MLFCKELTVSTNFKAPLLRVNLRIYRLLASVLCAASVAFGLVSTTVHAQYNYYQSGGFAFNQFNYPPIGNQQYKKPRGDGASSNANARAASAASASSKPTSARASANNNPLPYTRDKALSNKLREEFLQDFTKQMSATDGVEMRAMLEQADFVQVFAGYAQLQGLDSGTMEGLMAFWTGQSWAVANQKPLPTPQQYQGIAEQLRASLVQSPDWSRMNNEQRQMFFERLAYPLIVQKANYQAYVKQGKGDALLRMANATQAGLKQRGLDLQRLRLIDSGFAPL
jgi:hypothetical protein